MKVSSRAPALLSVAIAALVISFLPWQSVDLAGLSASRNEWHGIGVVAGLVTVVLVALYAVRVARVPLPLPIPPALLGLALAALLLLVTLLKVIADDEFRTAWAWIGLLMAIVLTVGAYLEAAPILRMLRTMRPGAGPGRPAAAAADAAAAAEAEPAPAKPAAAAEAEPAAAASGADGEWRCTMDTPMGEQTVGLTLSTAGGTLSGRADTAFGANAFHGGTVAGPDLAWRISVTEPLAIELLFRATVEGDRLSGTVDAGPFGEQPFSGTRV